MYNPGGEQFQSSAHREVFGPEGQLCRGAAVVIVQEAAADVVFALDHAVQHNPMVLLLTDDIKGCSTLWRARDPVAHARDLMRVCSHAAYRADATATRQCGSEGAGPQLSGIALKPDDIPQSQDCDTRGVRPYVTVWSSSRGCMRVHGVGWATGWPLCA